MPGSGGTVLLSLQVKAFVIIPDYDASPFPVEVPLDSSYHSHTYYHTL